MHSIALRIGEKGQPGPLSFDSCGFTQCYCVKFVDGRVDVVGCDGDVVDPRWARRSLNDAKLNFGVAFASQILVPYAVASEIAGVL
jgi:hypothetical protein